jgi:hypothetical protein
MDGKMVDMTPDELGYADKKMKRDTRTKLSIQHEFELEEDLDVLLYNFILHRCTTLDN